MIGFKIAGVHWAMTNPLYPRAAEVSSGLIQTSIDFDSDSTGHGYSKIIGLAKSLAGKGHGIVLHFTCLEMNDQRDYSPYSLAKSLVFWVANEAARQGVTIKGENALEGGVTGNWDSDGWRNITNAFDWASYAGLTVLRIDNVSSGDGLNSYARFISRYR